jgi:hypothetical protein
VNHGETGRRAFLLGCAALSGVAGCLGSVGSEPPIAETPGGADRSATPVDAETSSPLGAPEVVTERVDTRIEPAPLVPYAAQGFSFERPTNWRERLVEDEATTEFEYLTDDGRVLGTLRAWGQLNTLYDAVREAEAETVSRLSAADHAVLETRALPLADGREGRVVDYRLAGVPVRGSSVVSLAGPWILRLVVLAHEDAYVRFAETADAILASLAYTG